MTYGFLSGFIATVIAAVMAPSPSCAQGGPELVQKTLHTSDIQYRATRSPDTLSILFENFDLALVAGDGAAPTVTRVFPLTIPVTGAGKGATVRVQARGGQVCPDSAACLVIVWVNGHSKVLNSRPNKTSADFIADAEFSLPGADVHQAAIILIAEREAKRNDVAAMIKVHSLDLAIAPLTAAGGTKK
jgi:hypothetical protein